MFQAANIVEQLLGPNKLYLYAYEPDFDPQYHLKDLSLLELERYQAFRNIKRQQEYVATRLLCHEIFGVQEIKYETHGAPYIENHTYISISHAGNVVGIASNDRHEVGFDLELIHPKIHALYPKFLNTGEQQLFDLNNTEELISTWSFKESMYKLAGRKELLFKEELLLFKNGERVYGKIVHPDRSFYVDLQAVKYQDYIITSNVSPLRHTP